MQASELHTWLAQAAPNPYPDDKVDGIMGGDPAATVRGVADPDHFVMTPPAIQDGAQ